MSSLICDEHSDARCVGACVELVFNSTVVGSGFFCDIRVPEAGVPRRFLELRRRKDGRYAVCALDGAGGGVSVNGDAPARERVLVNGDTFRVGSAGYRFLDDPSERSGEDRGGAAADAGGGGGTEGRAAGVGVSEGAGRTARPDTPARSVGTGAVVLALGTGISRLLGMVREIVGAVYFGAGAAMDVFQTAFIIPNLFRRVLGETAVESAFLPAFKTYLARGKEREAWVLASIVFNLLMVALAVVVVGFHVLAPWIVRLLAPGFDAALAEQTVRLTRLMMPFTFFIGVAAFLGSLLLARGSFGPYAFAPVLFSVGEILGVVLFYRSLGLYSLGVGVLIGGAGQMLVQAYVLVPGKGRVDGYRPAMDMKHPGVRKILGLMGPILSSSVIDKVSDITKRVFTSCLAAGSLSALNYAFRLVHLPFAIIGLALGRSVLPNLADAHARQRQDEFRAHLFDGLNSCAFLMVPAAVGTAVLAVPIIDTVFAYGAWHRTNPDATKMTASALVFFAASLPSMSAVGILARAYHAMLEPKAPMFAAIRGLYVNILFSLCLVVTPLGHAGLALATVMDYLFQHVWLLVQIRPRLYDVGEPRSLRPILAPLVPVGAAAGLMGVVLGWGVHEFWPGTGVGAVARGLVLACLVGAGAVTYGMAALALRIPEMEWVWARSIGKARRLLRR